MNDQDLAAQAMALKGTAETMIKAGKQGAADMVTQRAVAALIEAAKKSKGNNPIVASLQVTPGLGWPEVLTIANVIYAA